MICRKRRINRAFIHSVGGIGGCRASFIHLNFLLINNPNFFTHRGRLVIHGLSWFTHRKARNTNGKASITDGKRRFTNGKTQNTNGKKLFLVGKSLFTNGKVENTNGKTWNTDGKTRFLVGKSLFTNGKTQNTNGKTAFSLCIRVAFGRNKAIKEASRKEIEKPCKLIEINKLYHFSLLHGNWRQRAQTFVFYARTNPHSYA